MRVPWDSMQFWVATALAGAALLWMVRGLIPIPWWQRRRWRRRRERRATLTVRGRVVR